MAYPETIESFLIKIGKIIEWDREANRLNGVGDINNGIIGASTDAARPGLPYTDGQSVFFDQTVGGPGTGTRGDPYPDVATAWADVDDITKFMAVQLDSNDLLITDVEKRLQTDNGVKANLGAAGWTEQSAPVGFTSAIILGIAYGGTRFVAVSGLQIITSDDSGVTWTLRTNATGWGAEINNSIIYDNGMWLIGGADGNYQKSTDGTTWTKFAGSGTDHIVSIAWDGSLFASAAYTGISTVLAGANNTIQSSSDGITWVNRTGAFDDPSNTIRAAAYGAGLFVLMGGDNNNSIETSPDGINWTLRSFSNFWPAGAEANDLVFDTDNLFFTAVGDLGSISTSPDGINWTFDDGSALANDLFSVDHGGSYVVIGATQKKLQNKIQKIDINAEVLGYDIQSLLLADIKHLVQNCDLNDTDINLFTNADFTGNKINGCDQSGSISGAITYDKNEILNSQHDVTATGLITFTNNRVTSAGDTLDLTSNDIDIRENLIIGSNFNFIAITINGAAVAVGDIKINENTIIGNIDINNSASTGKEQMRDNIIDLLGSLSAEISFEIESGNIRGGAITGVTLNPVVSGVAPLYKDQIDYELRRASEGFSSDSPLIAQAQFSEYTYLTVDYPNDLGCYHLNNQTAVQKWTEAFNFILPSNDNITHTVENAAKLNVSITGTPNSINDPDSRFEIIDMSFKALEEDQLSFIDRLEALKDMTVFISLDQALSAVPSITIDGNQSAGKFIIDIDAQDVPIGSRFVNNDTDIWIVNREPKSGDVTELVLSRGLVEALIDDQVIPLTEYAGIGEYQYVPLESKELRRPWTKKQFPKTGFTMRFVRKLP
jgi:hypothetical protein